MYINIMSLLKHQIKYSQHIKSNQNPTKILTKKKIIKIEIKEPNNTKLNLHNNHRLIDFYLVIFYTFFISIQFQK